jgi:hypothetical protein
VHLYGQIYSCEYLILKQGLLLPLFSSVPTGGTHSSLALSLSPSDPRACLPSVRQFLPVASFSLPSDAPEYRTRRREPHHRPSWSWTSSGVRGNSCAVAAVVPHTWGWPRAPVPPPLGDGGRSCCCQPTARVGRGRGCRRPRFVCLALPKRRGRANCRGPLLLRRSRFVCRGRVAQKRGRGTFWPTVLRTPRDDGERICLRPAPRVNLEQGRHRPRVLPRSTSRRCEGGRVLASLT